MSHAPAVYSRAGNTPMALSLSLDQTSGPLRRVRVGGRLDTSTLPIVEDQVSAILADSSAQVLVFDLRQLEALSDAGVRSFFNARKLLHARGGQVLLANVAPQILAALGQAGTIPAADVFASSEELEAYLQSIQLVPRG